jgi:hypothetical protein
MRRGYRGWAHRPNDRVATQVHATGGIELASQMARSVLVALATDAPSVRGKDP